MRLNPDDVFRRVTGVGELGRVREQVDEHLAELFAVRPRDARDVREPDVERQPLGRHLPLDEGHHLGHHVAHLDGPYVVVADRKKDVIISGGENVSSIEVEDVLFQHPAVAECAVIGVPHEKWGETVKALVVAREGQSVTEADLIEFCRGRMAHYKCPTSIEFRDALARTATGKLQKFKLRSPYWEGLDRQVN